MVRCNTTQFRVRSRVTDTRGGKALTFGFNLGPIAIFIIANVPEDLNSSKSSGALAYIKLNLRLENSWEEADDDG